MIAKDYVQILSAFLTPLIAALAAYIAWQQYQINHSSLRNQLYERRIRIFQAFISYLSYIATYHRISYERTIQFYADASEADFLFDEKVVSKLDELYKNGVRLATLQEKLYPSVGQGLPTGDERDRVVEEKASLINWFWEQTEVTRNLFRQQMRIR